MSARVCLLCGKTLSRIWGRSGEEFCSREHGNQYRLPQGMDRLAEANKYSTVLRRRENPKPLVLAIVSSEAEVRFPDSRGIRFTPAPRKTDWRVRSIELPTKAPAGEAAALGIPRAPESSHRVAYEMLRHRLPILVRRAREIGITTAGAVVRFVPLEETPQRGRDLSVSLVVGFRLHAKPEHRRTSTLSSRAQLVWQDLIHQPAAMSMDSSPRMLEAPLKPFRASSDRALEFTQEVGFATPGFHPLAKETPGGEEPSREFAVPVSKRNVAPIVLRLSVVRTSRGAGFAGGTPPPAVPTSSQRIAIVRFVQEYQSR